MSAVTYSRYADDLTFSTSQKEFPTELAYRESDNQSIWSLGTALIATIEHADFAINPAKTRMQVRPSRQVVTGLTVNAKVNIPQAYSRSVRSMCHSLFEKGSYHYPRVDDDEDAPAAEVIKSLSPLDGMLSHIYHVKRKAELVEKPHTPTAKAGKDTPGRRLYAKFLFYKYFVALERPLIMYEGPTDRIYMKYAIRHLAKDHPQLGSWDGSKFEPKTNLFKYGNKAHRILDLPGGSGTLRGFINQYKANLSRYKHQPVGYPVIVLLDNDQGLSKELQSELKKNFGIEVDLTTKASFYPLFANLYLVKTIEIGETGKSCIEDCFDASIKATQLSGKVLDLSKKPDPATTYGKKIFAEHVVVPKAGEINWSGFGPILSRIAAAIDHYKRPSSVLTDVA